MRILFDLQALQNGSRSRGIGRYVKNLLKALAERPDVEVVALLNSAFAETLTELSAEVAGIVGENRVLVWQGLKNASFKRPENAERVQLAAALFDEFLASLSFDLLLTGAVFDGHTDNTVVSIAGKRPYQRAVIHYDLIPLLNPEDFFYDENYRRFYQQRFQQLGEAEHLFAISEASAREAAEHLPAGERTIVPIGAAIDTSVFRSDLAPDPAVLRRLGITKPFILHVSALERRKNFDGLIRAYGKLPRGLRDKYQLVFVGTAHPEYAKDLRAEVARTGLKADQLILLSGLDDLSLAQLYRQAALFCFPSLHEGFGLPPLEAMASGCPTIGSNTSSIPEVIGDADLMFDPQDEAAMARLMQRLLTDRAEAARAAEAGQARAATFSWAKVAERLVAALHPIAAAGAVVPPPSLDQAVARFVQKQAAPPSEANAADYASALVANLDLATAFRARPAPDEPRSWRIEGPFESSYSLALLNRETARALEELGFHVALRSMKAPGDESVDDGYLAAQPDLARMHARVVEDGLDPQAIVSRNNYPPLVDDMTGRVRALHHYAWEESGFPAKWVAGFNANLSLMTCLSEHVRKVMIDNGVTVPMLVSGCGVDHWERVEPDPDYRVTARGFRFLHVSSCFPRKGVKALLEAYGMAFSADDDVSLVIKTFHNPHNEIEQMVAEWQAARPDYPDVVLIFADLTEPQLKALYRQCDVMVGPSYAEGYGLPLAEAMLTGIPVITTAWGGQLDFCNDGNAWLVDYTFERARSHFNLWASAWARADLDSLTEAMLSAFRSSREARAAMAARGRRQLLAEHKWSDVVSRLSVATRTLPLIKREPTRIGWISTWNSKCGIATYSAHLIEHMTGAVQVFSPKNEDVVGTSDTSKRSWTQSKKASHLDLILDLRQAEAVDVFVIQFNYGFYNHADLSDFIHSAKAMGKKVVLFLHATHHPGDQFAAGAENFHLRHIVPTLRACDRLLVHSIADLNRLKDLGLVDNVALFPHGVLEFDGVPPATAPGNRQRVIGTYGFALPHKGLVNTIKAAGRLRSQGHDFALKMTNALYPSPLSEEYVEEMHTLIHELGLRNVVDFRSEFLTDEQSASRLAATDLLAFPYENTEESASGAVRYGMAMKRPVLVSRNPIFKDLQGAVFECESGSPEAIAAGILAAFEQIDAQTEVAAEIARNAESWRLEHSFRDLGQRLSNICDSLVNQF